MNPPAPVNRIPVVIPNNGAVLQGELAVPARARGVVIFAQTIAHGRHCPCNLQVAAALHEAGLATFLFDLAMPDPPPDLTVEPAVDGIPLLAGRLVGVTRWVLADSTCGRLRLGYFGSHDGAAAALIAAAWLGAAVGAVVARRGRPDLAEGAFRRVRSPVLFIVGERDTELLARNRSAIDQMTSCPCELSVVPGADSLIERPGDIEQVAVFAREWFARHLAPG